MKFVRFFEDFTQNTQDPTFSDRHFARNKNNTTRQSKQTRRAFVKLDGFALPDAGGFGNSDGENDFMFGLPLLGSGVDAGGADEIGRLCVIGSGLHEEMLAELFRVK